MAETIFQKRINELDEYTQLLSTEPGYEDPATVWIAVDIVTWPESKKMSLIEFIANLHKEQGPAVVTSVNIAVAFDTVMSTVNYYLNIQTARIFVLPSGDSIKRTIPYKNLSKTINGFTLELEEYAVGDSVDFLAFE